MHDDDDDSECGHYDGDDKGDDDNDGDYDDILTYHPLELTRS